MGPEEPSSGEKNVEAEVSEEREKTEHQGDQEKDTWTDQKLRMTFYSSTFSYQFSDSHQHR